MTADPSLAPGPRPTASDPLPVLQLRDIWKTYSTGAVQVHALHVRNHTFYLKFLH